MTVRRQNLLFLLVMLVAADALYGLSLLATRAQMAEMADVGGALETWLPPYLVVHVIALFVVAIAWVSAADGEVGRAEQLDRIEAAARERSRP